MKAEIRLRGRKFDLSLPLGNGPAVVESGGAIIEEGARPEDDPLTIFTGNELVKLAVPVLFDGWPRVNVWPDVAQVLSLCRGRNRNRPPDFTATGPIPFSGSRFVMTLPEWGDGLRSDGGALVRQALVLKLVQFEDPDTIRFRRRGHKMGLDRPAVPLTYRARKGQTLLGVSRDVYDTTNRAKEIGDLNGIRDTRKPLETGRVLKLPGE